jgi:hypothetical protein
LKLSATTERLIDRIDAVLRSLPRHLQPTAAAPAAVLVAVYFDALRDAKKGGMRHGR